MFAIWFTTRAVIAPACACADSGLMGPGEKGGTRVAMVNRTNQSRGRAIPSLEVSLQCASIEVWKEYPLTLLRTRVVRVEPRMTASASCVPVEDRMQRESIGRCSLGEVCHWPIPYWLRGCEGHGTTRDCQPRVTGRRGRVDTVGHDGDSIAASHSIIKGA